MKKTATTALIHRAAALLAALALTLPLLSTARAENSEAYGSEVWLQDTALQDGVVLSDNVYWSGYYDKPRHEYYITYSPSGGTPPAAEDPDIPSWLIPPDPVDTGADTAPQAPEASYSASSGVRPSIYYGASMCDRNSAAAAAQFYEGLGFRVLGIINGDFYNTGSGAPLGLVVSNGKMLSSDGGVYAIGFRTDGSAVIGQPQLAMTARTGEVSHPVAAVNKTDSVGVTLWTHEYRTDCTSGGHAEGPQVTAAILDGSVAIGSQLTIQVETVEEGKGSVPIHEGQVVLSSPGDCDEADNAFLRSLTPGQVITVSFTTPDPSWNEVTEAIGALYLLVQDGVPQTGFEVSAAPRTAVGVKANGDVVFYTIDGRQNSHSMGCSLGVLAQRMAELGCVTALCLDGGGSTTLRASTPDRSDSKLVNSPSDGAQRKVSNLIALIAPGGATGEAHSINLSANAPAVLPGQKVAFSANLADTHYYPMDGQIQFTSSAGTMEGSTLTAPRESGPVTVTASWGGLSAHLDVQVVDIPDEIFIQRNGSDISALTLKPGETVELGGRASYRHRSLAAAASDFTWWISPELGSIDDNGRITAAATGTDVFGFVVAKLGERSVSIQTSIRAASPFADTADHWASQYMTELYYKDILRGTTEEDGKLYAYPDQGVTRAEFAVLLSRYLGLDVSQYEGLETPFADIGQVDGWALNSVRAMYAMGIIKGSEVDGQTVFEPRGTLTRSQAVTMLDRMLSINAEDSSDTTASEDGEPSLPALPGEDSGFQPPTGDSEAPDGQEETVGPESGEELGESTQPQGGEAPGGPEDILASFEDAEEILPYAVEHFRALVALGVIEGSGNRLEPNATMTRAAICKVLAMLP